MQLRWSVASLLVALAAGGCGGDSGSAFEGIYEVDTWTHNEAGCDAEGADILSTQGSTTFYIKHESFLGVKFLNVKFCDDVADCEALAGEGDTIHLGMYGFDQGGDTEGWRSEWFSGFAVMEVCDGSYVQASLTGDDARVRIEVRDTPASGFAPDAEGDCTDEDGEQAAQGQACGRLEVLTATRVADLP